MDVKQVEKLSKAVGDATRLSILFTMAECKGSFQCADIMSMTNLAQPSVSHHVKTLIDAGLIEPEKDGRTYSYRLNRPLIKKYINMLSRLTKTKKQA